MCIVFATLLLCGCAPRKKTTYKAALFAMDTYCTIEAHGDRAEAAVKAAGAELLRLEALFSISRPKSDVSRINAAGGYAVRLSPDTAALLAEALALSAETGGAFDVSIEPVVRLWGFYDDRQRPPAPDEIARALALCDYTRLCLDGLDLRLDAGQGVDLGGIGKGYASDRMADILRDRGVSGALLSLGGNVYALGEREGGGAWRVALRDPWDESAVLGVIEASNCAIITAGSYQRSFEADGQTYHHIMDPETGCPAQSGLLSVTVIAESGTRADALSTALFVMGEERAKAFWRADGGFDMILVTEDGRILPTAGAEFSPLPEGRKIAYYIE